MGGIASISSIAGGGAFQALGGLQASDASIQSDKYNQQMALYNAQVQQQKANSDATMSLVNTQRTVGAGIASAAAMGQSLSGGNLADITYQSLHQGQLDAANIRYKGALEAYDSQQQASLYGQKAQNTQDSQLINFAGSLLGTGGSVAKTGTDYALW
jgi:hypothetical protein